MYVYIEKIGKNHNNYNNSNNKIKLCYKTTTENAWKIKECRLIKLNNKDYLKLNKNLSTLYKNKKKYKKNKPNVNWQKLRWKFFFAFCQMSQVNVRVGLLAVFVKIFCRCCIWEIFFSVSYTTPKQHLTSANQPRTLPSVPVNVLGKKGKYPTYVIIKIIDGNFRESFRL